ncbi:hypothetical protein B7P43_G12382 [Cryptotermes secundus]|uniref:Uncharacterized protein n=1 Tax=Cryptotermes secundus TaxID=105785 RepID=A0A2J7RBM4_9NEOP|nr:hypothetical protein B7P43_G12382 [Cryptotermes secundus]
MSGRLVNRARGTEPSLWTHELLLERVLQKAVVAEEEWTEKEGDAKGIKKETVIGKQKGKEKGMIIVDNERRKVQDIIRKEESYKERKNERMKKEHK